MKHDANVVSRCLLVFANLTLIDPCCCCCLCREPRPFPKLHIDPSITNIDDFRFEHFTVEGYDAHPTIKMEMAV